MIVSFFLMEIYQFVKFYEPEFPKKVLIISRYLVKSQKVSTTLENLDLIESLDNLDKNLDTAKSQFKILDFKNLAETKNNFDLTVGIISTGFKSLSRQIKKS